MHGCLKIMILVTIASVPTSSEGMTEFRPAHLALLKQKMSVNIDCRQKNLCC